MHSDLQRERLQLHAITPTGIRPSETFHRFAALAASARAGMPQHDFIYCANKPAQHAIAPTKSSVIDFGDTDACVGMPSHATLSGTHNS
jgi:hypothetical protein